MLVTCAFLENMITIVACMTTNIVFYFVVRHIFVDKTIEMNLNVEFSICFFTLFFSFDFVAKKWYDNLWLISKILKKIFWILLQFWNIWNEWFCVFDETDFLNTFVTRNFDWLSLKTSIVVVYHVDRKFFVNQHVLHDFDCFCFDVEIDRVQLFQIEFENSKSLVLDCFLCLKF